MLICYYAFYDAKTWELTEQIQKWRLTVWSWGKKPFSHSDLYFFKEAPTLKWLMCHLKNDSSWLMWLYTISKCRSESVTEKKNLSRQTFPLFIETLKPPSKKKSVAEIYIIHTVVVSKTFSLTSLVFPCFHWWKNNGTERENEGESGGKSEKGGGVGGGTGSGRKGKKGETESLLVGGNEFSCQRISPPQSTLYIIM